MSDGTAAATGEEALAAGKEALATGLAHFLSGQVGEPVTVSGLRRIASVGNAREPWELTATWAGTSVRAVLLMKAAAGQLEAELAPEFRTLQRLEGQGVPIARPLWLDEAGEAVGQPFFASEWVPGTAETRVLRRAEPGGPITAVARQLAAAAARLHAVDPGPFDHLPPATTESAALAQLELWADQFVRHRLEPHPELVYLIAWLRRRPPTAQRVAVVHGDLRFGNLLYDGDRLTALVDWEMVHRGDPVEDLGWVYRTLWSPERALDFDTFLDAYVEAGGVRPTPDHLRWYQVFGEVKHAVISLTGGRSFADRATLSLRHADRAATVPPMVTRALQLVSAPC